MELDGRTSTAITLASVVITALILVASATSWQRFALAVAIQAVMTASNIAVMKLAVPRLGPRAELARLLLNSVVPAIGYTLIDWPMPVWLWLPFCAVTIERSAGRHAVVMLISVCIVQGVVAIAAGVPWLYPVTFGVFAGCCWALAGARLRIIGDMLAAAEAQRDELSGAHDELKRETAARERAELELRQAQKLEAVGRLSAGVAHEINTPIQFIGDNLEFLGDSVSELLALRAHYLAARTGTPEERELALRRAAELERAIDIDYLVVQLPKAVAMASEGVARVAAIVRSMKRFSHTSGVDHAPADLVEALEATLVISRSEYAGAADIERRLGDLPPVVCNIGEINQVMLNLIVNAAHAIEDANGPEGLRRGRITLTSRRLDDSVVISIADDGCGIPNDLRDRIFEPFFTTKQVGRGTGQGLAVSRAIVERHGGTLTFVTELGRGTTFHIRLPVKRAPIAARRAAAAYAAA